MRYSKEHKRQTHEKMVQTASKRFREQGYEGVSIGDLMSELKLTHGGFYRHFPNKQRLYTEALAFGVADVQARLKSRVADVAAPTLREVILTYLSMEHCTEAADGCPVAALSGEISRQSDEVQTAFDSSLQTYMGNFLDLMPGATDANRRQQFLVLFSGMAGALSVARAVADEALRASILEAARNFYLKTFCE